MIDRGFGRIILMSSDAVWSPPKGASLPYVASKGALTAVMRALAVDLGEYGIAVTAVAPGTTDTAAARDVVPPSGFDALVGRQAMKRTLVPADTASVVAFLASDAALALTGQVIVVDGGNTKR
jgi:3-oxoacyl-[acyl-carrier protein] reductase